VKGKIDAATEAAAEQDLFRKGFHPIEIEPSSSMPGLEKVFPSLFAIRTEDVIDFSRQLATLLEAGVGILPALELLREQMTNKSFKKVLGSISDDLRMGISFSEAVAKHPQAFSDIYSRMIAVGERMGGLETSLRQVATYLEKQSMAVKKTTRALTYPALVLLLAFGVITLLLTVALPPMIRMFTGFGTELPLPTRILIGVTDFISTYKLYLGGALISIILLIALYLKHPTGQRHFHTLLLGFPIVGRIILAGEMARLSRTMSILLRAGLTLPQIMDLAQQTSNNTIVREALKDVQQEMLEGQGLSRPMSKRKLFPAPLVQMVMVGEESGSLDSTLATIADSYEAEADERTSRLIGMIEPAMIIFVGLIVGFIALSVLLPMYSILGALG
jgi:type IV pilus assembly protein PilC